ncbi:hypothetical protein [Sporosarcina sp. E16_8]|nr:hypothetical protein [Sporosarcina sp. E16_8]
MVGGFPEFVGHFDGLVGNSFVGWTLFVFRCTLLAVGWKLS